MHTATKVLLALLTLATTLSPVKAEETKNTHSNHEEDMLVQGYIQKQLDASLPGTGKPKPSARPMVLNLNTKLCTDYLAPYIEDWAAGRRTNTTVVIPFEALGIYADGYGATQNEAIENAYSSLDIDTDQFFDFLLYEHPYELYWFDKTNGMNVSALFDAKYGNPVHVTLTGLEVGFSVAYEYRLHSYDMYTLDPSTGNRVSQAIDNAKKIHGENKEKSCYEQLIAYRDAICELTDYNSYAAIFGDYIDYGNPWQIIWVFDDDPETTVVCEGYAKAFKYLCDLAGWDVDIVDGVMSTNGHAGDHMWNIVHMDDGKNYLVDVTNCDKGTPGYPDLLFLKGYYSKTEGSYTYRCGKDVVTYEYDKDVVDYYLSEKLVLSSTDYNPALAIKTPVFGFCLINDKYYWFEDSVKQGVIGDPRNIWDKHFGIERGREIYDPASEGWYWLDAIFDGAKAVGKEVWMPYIYQEEDTCSNDVKWIVSRTSDEGMCDYVYQCMVDKSGKWVRYDENGKMLKGWVTISGKLAELYPEQAGNTYYYDTITGLMAKGWIRIKGNNYHFNEITGRLE